jgi:hypothetical protein
VDSAEDDPLLSAEDALLLRYGRFSTEIFERYQRSEKALVAR